jgi:hypothetical protein
MAKAKGLQAIADWAVFDSNDAAVPDDEAEGLVEEGEQKQHQQCQQQRQSTDD